MCKKMLIKILVGIADGEATASRIADGVGGIADGEALARSVLKKPVYILFVHFAHHFAGHHFAGKVMAGKVMSKVNK